MNRKDVEANTNLNLWLAAGGHEPMVKEAPPPSPSSPSPSPQGRVEDEVVEEEDGEEEEEKEADGWDPAEPVVVCQWKPLPCKAALNELAFAPVVNREKFGPIPLLVFHKSWSLRYLHHLRHLHHLSWHHLPLFPLKKRVFSFGGIFEDSLILRLPRISFCQVHNLWFSEILGDSRRFLEILGDSWRLSLVVWSRLLKTSQRIPENL